MPGGRSNPRGRTPVPHQAGVKGRGLAPNPHSSRLSRPSLTTPRFPPLEVFERRPPSPVKPSCRGRHPKTFTGAALGSLPVSGHWNAAAEPAVVDPVAAGQHVRCWPSDHLATRGGAEVRGEPCTQVDPERPSSKLKTIDGSAAVPTCGTAFSARAARQAGDRPSSLTSLPTEAPATWPRKDAARLPCRRAASSLHSRSFTPMAARRMRPCRRLRSAVSLPAVRHRASHAS